MSILFPLIKAWMLGIAIAAPIGPIGMLCIRKTLEFGLLGAIAVGIGAAIADSIYGFIVVLGLTIVANFLLEKVIFIKILGGIFLLYLAYKEIKTLPNSTVNIGKNKALGKLTAEVFFLTLTNPMTILSFIAIFASITSINRAGSSTVEAFAMVIGIFLGSMTWWLILGTIVLKIKHKLPGSWINYIRYLSAVILSLFGVMAVGSGLWR